MKSLVILQARMSSTRLPGKTMELVNGIPMIGWQIQRIQKSKVQKLVVATSEQDSDNKLAEYVSSLGVSVYRGSKDDVFSRFIGVLSEYDSQVIVRLTGDCPLVMPSLINEMLDYFEKSKIDYLSNTNPPTFPDGLDIEIFTREALLKLKELELTAEEKEHVTLGIYTRPKKYLIQNYRSQLDMSKLRWTVDYPEDLDFVREIYSQFPNQELKFDVEDVLKLVESKMIRENPISGEFRNVSLETNFQRIDSDKI